MLNWLIRRYVNYLETRAYRYQVAAYKHTRQFAYAAAHRCLQEAINMELRASNLRTRLQGA